MKKYFLLILIAFSFIRCEEDYIFYELDFLQGDWQRIESTDYRNDSMVVFVNNDSAKIVSIPNNLFFKNDQLKWTSITSISSDGNFSLEDWSSDSTFSPAIIYVINDSVIELKHTVYINAPGGFQKWKRN